MLRRFTNQQFQNAATIDGNRLAKMLSDLVDRFNALRPIDLEARWVESKYVCHYRGCPVSVGDQQPHPWMLTDATLNDGVDETLPEPEQRWRHKGFAVEGLPLNGAKAGLQHAWTTSFWFEKPAVAQRVTVFLQTDGGDFDNTFEFPTGEGGPPPGNQVGDICKDMQVILYVANPFLTENSSQDNVELLRRDFRASSQWLTPIAGSGTIGAMLPAENGVAGGVMIDFEFHEVHIPSKSRVYMAVILPEYDSSYDTPWGEGAVFGQFYSLTLTVLEPTQR